LNAGTTLTFAVRSVHDAPGYGVQCKVKVVWATIPEDRRTACEVRGEPAAATVQVSPLVPVTVHVLTLRTVQDTVTLSSLCTSFGATLHVTTSGSGGGLQAPLVQPNAHGVQDSTQASPLLWQTFLPSALQ
jgi:hypothetical protein